MQVVQTVIELDEAIDHFLGATITALMREANTARPRLLDMACLKAFVEDCNSPFSQTLRAWWKELNTHGFFPKTIEFELKTP